MVKNRLKEIRMGTYYMNQKEFATFLGIEYKTYNRIEKGVVPTSQIMFKIANKLNLKIEDIFQFSDEQF